MKKTLKSTFDTSSSTFIKSNDPFSYKKCNTETSINSPISGKAKIHEKLKESFQEDDIISSIAKKNIKNFLNYKRWKKSTTLQKPEDETQNKNNLSKNHPTLNNFAKHPENPQKAPDNPEMPSLKYKNIQPYENKSEQKTPGIMQKLPLKLQKSDSFKKNHNNLKHIYKKMINQKQVMTKSLSDMHNLLNKSKFSRTFSGEFSVNNKSVKKEAVTEKTPIIHKKQEKNLKEMNKLAQIVSKVKNFKMNFSDKNIESINKLLESVKSLNKFSTQEKSPPINNNIKTLQAIYSKKKKAPMFQKKYVLDSAEKPINNKPVLSIKLMKQRKSFDQVKSEKKPNKELSPLPKKQENCFTYYMSLLDYFIRNPNDLDYFNLLYREHFLQSLAAYNYCAGLKIPPDIALADKKIYLGPNPKNLKTLVFDLDETLVHCNEVSDIPSDIKIEVMISENETLSAGVNIRPFSLELLKELKESFELVIFTASHSSYANKVIDYLDPQKNLIKHRLFREHCMVTEQGIFIKDLRIFGDRKLENIILVDNALYSFAYQIENGVPIIPFYDNKQDKELLSLKIYLEGLNYTKDCREINKKTFKFRQYDKFDNIEDLLGCLFQGLDFDI